MKNKNTLVKQLADMGIKPNGNAIKWGKQRVWPQVVTPTQCSLIEKNHNLHNRTRDSIRVDFLVNEILAGKYNPLIRTIKFDENGELIDGQNFCAAVVKSGVPVKVLISDNHPETDMELIDNGKNRTAADNFLIYGQRIKDVFIEKNSSKLAKMVRHLNAVETYGNLALGVRDKLSNRLVSNPTLLAMLKNEKNYKSYKETIYSITNIVEKVFDGRVNEMKKIIGDQVVYTTFELLKNKYGIKTAVKFFKEFFEGRGKLLLPRNYLMKRKEENRQTSNYAIQYYVMSVIFDAWKRKKPLTSNMYELTVADERQRQYPIVF